jgi:asparagine synthase (glutamine-hydrolysing)
MTPQDDWFCTSLWQDKIKLIIYSDSFAARGLFDVGKVKKLYQKHINNEVQIARAIWKWVHTELWFKKYID